MVEKFNYKIFLIIVKYTPLLIGFMYFTTLITECLGFYPIVIPTLFYISPLSMLFILSASFALNFCIWHRLPIYYSLVLQIINTIDYYSPIVFTNSIMLYIYLIITIIFILLGMYFKNKHNKLK